MIDLEAKLVTAGELARDAMLELWAANIWDPPPGYHHPEAERWRDAITAMIASDQGLGWHWEGRYQGDGDFEWCGAAAAFGWARAGLKLEVRRPYFASTYRLHRYAHYRPLDERNLNARPVAGPYRQVVQVTPGTRRIVMPDGSAPRAGDIALVGGEGTGPGKHVTVVDEYDADDNVLRTIEGNARGRGPDGRPRQGVVRAERPVRRRHATEYCVLWVIRPSATDLA